MHSSLHVTSKQKATKPHSPPAPRWRRGRPPPASRRAQPRRPRAHGRPNPRRRRGRGAGAERARGRAGAARRRRVSALPLARRPRRCCSGGRGRPGLPLPAWCHGGPCALMAAGSWGPGALQGYGELPSPRSSAAVPPPAGIRPPPRPGGRGDMAAHKPVEWVQAVVNRFDEQVEGAAPGRGGGAGVGGPGAGGRRGRAAAPGQGAAGGSAACCLSSSARPRLSRRRWSAARHPLCGSAGLGGAGPGSRAVLPALGLASAWGRLSRCPWRAGGAEVPGSASAPLSPLPETCSSFVDGIGASVSLLSIFLRIRKE